MSIKEIVEQESRLLSEGIRDTLHLHREGSFVRAYEWSAFLACHYLHEFKVTKRVFKGIEQPVAFIGFPETSLGKWTPEGAEQTAIGDKHLAMRLPDTIFKGEDFEAIDAAFVKWKEDISLSDPKPKADKKDSSVIGHETLSDISGQHTLTAVMQRILAYPIESKSPLESMAFLADVKRQLTAMI